jgi:transcription antitermination factor NusG
MRVPQIRVKVSNPEDPSRFFEEDFWVEPGAIYSSAPEQRMKEIDIRPLQVRELILSNGQHELRVVGEAVLTGPRLHESRTCPIIFSSNNSQYVLGATAFENLSLQEIANRMSASASSKPLRTFEKGESVKIISGPFATFTGIVEELHPNQNTLTVSVTLFGRSTSVELDFWQVEKD